MIASSMSTSMAPPRLRQETGFTFVWCAVGALLLCMTAAPAVMAQDVKPRGIGAAAGGMATRSVSKYLGLERALQDGIAQRDRTAVLQVLAEDFEVRTSATPDAIAINEWLRRELASPGRDRIVRDLAVREFDDLAIVSFLLDSAGAPGHAKVSKTLFVVDVWRQSSGKLLTRYVERPASAPPASNRPTGRE